MTFGLSVKRTNGDVVFSSQIPNYVLLEKRTITSATNNITVTSVNCPIVFSRVTSTTTGYSAASASNQVSYIGSNTWQITVGCITNPAMESTYYATAGVLTLDIYIFGSPSLSASGYGIKMGETWFGTGAQLPLVIKNIVSMNPNGNSPLGSYSTYVDIGTPQGKWAGVMSPSSQDTQGNLFNFISSTTLWYWIGTTSYFVGGLYSNFFFPSNTRIATIGYVTNYTQNPKTLPWTVWLIDTYFYGG